MFYLYLRDPTKISSNTSPYMLTNNTYSIYSSGKYSCFTSDPRYGWHMKNENAYDRYRLITTVNSFEELKDQYPELFI